MRKRSIVRLQLLALVAVLLLLLYRVFDGPPAPKGAVVFSDIEPDQLQHDVFRLAGPDTLVVEATGSFEGSGEGAALAAYAWILRRDDRTLAWVMDARNARRGRGTLAEAADTLGLREGTYDVYFTSFGNRHEGGGDAPFWQRLTHPDDSWRNDNRKWQLALRPLSGEAGVERLEGEAAEAVGPQGEGLLWTSAPAGGFVTAEYLFDVQRPVQLRVYALGEIGDTQMDYGWIEDALTGERVWEMTRDNTEAAGGWDVNRRFEGTVALAPSIYRAVYKTDARQSHDDWSGNPPFDPGAWGLSLFVANPALRGAIAAFDPWETRRPVVQLTQVGSNVLYTAQVEVRRPVRLLAYAVGELGSGLYDYAWITNDQQETRIWEMNRDASQPAGGDENNRKEMAFLQLEPGRYTISYQTDGSHAYGDWQHGEPEHPERWGVTLFPVTARFDTSAVRVLAQARQEVHEEGEAPEAPPPPPPDTPPPPALGEGVALLQATRLGSEAQEKRAFELSDPSALHIYALGEISLSGRYDYGWIERADNGETVWEMTWQNTRPAGGDDRNRLFDGVVHLQPGRYVVHFKTDFSHNFDDFGDRAPENPEAWGITIEKM